MKSSSGPVLKPASGAYLVMTTDSHPLPLSMIEAANFQQIATIIEEHS